MPLAHVIRALEKLTGNNCNDGEPTSSQEDEDPNYFCVEDTFQSCDISVSVDGIGELQFPVTDVEVKKLIEVSSKAKFGKGEQTILDTSVRDTQVIPASMLDVKISEEAFNAVLERIARGLNINQSNALVPHLYNMLIYGPGQFFKMHRDSSKQTNMVATLVIVLPCDHKGGDLVITHNFKTHVFFGSKNPNLVKCVVFYSDCKHEIKRITEGFRIALTYNVVLKPAPVIAPAEIDPNLSDAINSYFAETRSEKIVYLLNHRYSENNLRWNFLKGLDRTYAYALLAVAKKQNRIPCLALSTYYEMLDSYCLEDVRKSYTRLYNWIDEHNLKMNSVMSNISVPDDEVCYTQGTKESFKPYETEESGPTGNAGETTEHWYRRGCVVIWSSKWSFSTGFQNAISDLHKLTTSVGNERRIIEVITEAGSDFMNKEMWRSSDTAQMLIDIVTYLNDAATAELILSDLSEVLLRDLDRLLQLEKQFDKGTWVKITSSWKITPSRFVGIGYSISVIEGYISRHYNVGESPAVDFLMEEVVQMFMDAYAKENLHRYTYSNPYKDNTNGRTDKNVMQQLYTLLEICVKLRKTSLQQKLIQHICTTSDVFKPVSLGELFLKLENDMTLNQSPSLEHFHQLVLARITAQISELSSSVNSWYVDIKLTCNCRFCAPVEAFFKSETRQKVVCATAPNRQHVESQLYSTVYPLILYTEKIGSPHKLVIEKDPAYMTQRQKLLQDLVHVKRQLDFVKIQFDNCSGNQDFPNKRQKILSSNEK